MPRMWMRLCVGMVTGTVVLIACNGIKAPIANFRPECPNHDTTLSIAFEDSVRTIQGAMELATVGPKTDIVEFHDCQRFVIPGDTADSYGQLVAIFASDTIARWNDFPREKAVTIALIFNYDSTYEPLHIERYFSCLYAVSRSEGVVRAWILPVGVTHEACAESLDPDNMPSQARPLVVSIDRKRRFSTRDYPAVARWDWDSFNGHQYIGISCRPFGWCNISGDDQLHTSPDYEDLTLPSRQERTFAVKGWYDFQQLANATGSPVTLSRRWGALFPAPDLGLLNDTIADFAEWRFVAQATLDLPDDGYLERFNFRGGGLGAPHQVGASRIYLCRGSRNDCHVPTNQADCAPTNTWWSMVTSPTDTLYRCVTRRGHEDKRDRVRDIPATVRWRFQDDETAWIRCAFGCCTLE